MIPAKNYKNVSTFVKVIQRNPLASFFPDKVYLLCIQELVGRPMYTELVEGEQGKLEPENNRAAAAVGIKKFLVDVSNISYYVRITECEFCPFSHCCFVLSKNVGGCVYVYVLILEANI